MRHLRRFLALACAKSNIGAGASGGAGDNCGTAGGSCTWLVLGTRSGFGAGGSGGAWWGESARLDFFGAAGAGAGAGGDIERRFLAARDQRPKATDQRHPVAALRASGPPGTA